MFLLTDCKEQCLFASVALKTKCLRLLARLSPQGAIRLSCHALLSQGRPVDLCYGTPSLTNSVEESEMNEAVKDERRKITLPPPVLRLSLVGASSKSWNVLVHELQTATSNSEHAAEFFCSEYNHVIRLAFGIHRDQTPSIRVCFSRTSPKIKQMFHSVWDAGDSWAIIKSFRIMRKSHVHRASSALTDKVVGQ